jgi:putative sigma-54 modulation protein
MNISISGRHMDVTDAIRSHVESGLQRVRRHFDRVIDVDVILSAEKKRHRQTAEVNLSANGLRVNAKESSGDLYASIDSAISKIERQVSKHRDRIKRHQPRTARESRALHHNVLEFTPLPPVDEGASAEPRHRVVHRESIPLQSMTIDEAAFQLELRDDDFLVFANAETNQVNVVYARGDGTYGLIETES